MEVQVLNSSGESTGRSINLPDQVFNVEPNQHVMYLAVKQYQAHQRQGTHKSKERAEIRGSTRKIKRQKGTGTARMGSIKSPTLRGGGRAFGPRPRKYKIKLNKKVKSLALASVLSEKLTKGEIQIVEDFSFERPSTKSLIGVFNQMNPNGGRTALVTNDYDTNLILSSRNIQKSKVINWNEINVYEIMYANHVLITENTIKSLIEKTNKAN